jgi:hypothetical protein
MSESLNIDIALQEIARAAATLFDWQVSYPRFHHRTLFFC